MFGRHTIIGVLSESALKKVRYFSGKVTLNIFDLTQCPRCLDQKIVEVHGHYQCGCGFYIAECCTGEGNSLKSFQPKIRKKQLDEIDKMIAICDSFIRDHSKVSIEYSKII